MLNEELWVGPLDAPGSPGILNDEGRLPWPLERGWDAGPQGEAIASAVAGQFPCRPASCLGWVDSAGVQRWISAKSWSQSGRETHVPTGKTKTVDSPQGHSGRLEEPGAPESCWSYRLLSRDLFGNLGLHHSARIPQISSLVMLVKAESALWEQDPGNRAKRQTWGPQAGPGWGLSFWKLLLCKRGHQGTPPRAINHVYPLTHFQAYRIPRRLWV